MAAALPEASSARRLRLSPTTRRPPVRPTRSHSRLCPSRGVSGAAALVLVAVGLAVPVRAQAPAVPESGELGLALRLELEAPAAAPAALDATMAYVPLRDHRLAAVDLAHGRTAWTLPLAATTAPALGDGLVFVATADQVTALAPDGAVRWRLPLAGGVSAALLWDTGWLIVPAGGDVLCLRAADGTVLWSHRTSSTVSARPAIAADRVYVSLEDGRVVALGLRDGAPVWERRLGGRAGPVLALDDRLFVGSADRFFYCLATKDGGQRWRWRTGGIIVGSPAVDEQRVYFNSWDNTLRALNRGNGHLRWRTHLPLRPSGGPLRLGRLLFVAGLAADVRAYRVETGRPAGRFTRPAELATPPQIVPHDVPDLQGLLLLTLTGELMVLQRRIEPAIVPLPQGLGVAVPLEAPPAPES